jgi:hypothetical protein
LYIVATFKEFQVLSIVVKQISLESFPQARSSEL